MILTATVQVMALLPLAALLLLLRLISDRPFAGPDLAFLVLAVNLVVVLPLWVLASLDRARRRRRPATWYRFLAGVALLLLLVDLSAVPAALALPSGVVGPRYTETVVFELAFRSLQWLAHGLATGLAASVAVLSLRLRRSAKRGRRRLPPDQYQPLACQNAWAASAVP